MSNQKPGNIPGKPEESIPGALLLDGLLQSFLLGTIVNQAYKYWLSSKATRKSRWKASLGFVDGRASFGDGLTKGLRGEDNTGAEEESDGRWKRGFVFLVIFLSMWVLSVLWCG